MLEKRYRELQKEMAKEKVFVINSYYGAATAAVEFTVFGLGLTALLHVRPYSLPYWLLELFLGLAMFRAFVVVHECGHKTLFKRKETCTAVGSIASVICLVPYVSWRNIHKQHHKWVGVVDKDPTQKGLLELHKYSEAKSKLARVIWKLWIPVMFVKFLFVTFWGYGFRELAAGRRKEGWGGVASCLVCLIGPVTAFALLGWHGFWVTFGPMFIVYFVFFENVSLPQHSGLFPYLEADHPHPIPNWEHDAITRTTNRPNWTSLVLSYYFNLHTEHHLFPSAPWYRLPKVTRAIVGMESYQRVHFLSFMVALRKLDPMAFFVSALPRPSDAPSQTLGQTSEQGAE